MQGEPPVLICVCIRNWWGFFFQWGTKCYETYRVIEQKGGPDKMTDLSGLNSISIGLLGKHFQLIGSVFSKGIWEM